MCRVPGARDPAVTAIIGIARHVPGTAPPRRRRRPPHRPLGDLDRAPTAARREAPATLGGPRPVAAAGWLPSRPESASLGSGSAGQRRPPPRTCPHGRAGPLPRPLTPAHSPGQASRRHGTVSDLASGLEPRDNADNTSMTSGFWQRVRGRSMAPALRDGDEVWLEPIGPVVAGDVVVARIPGSRTGTVLHRVVREDEQGVWTRGDACRADDPLSPRVNILFRATSFRRRGRVAPIPPPAGPTARGLWRARARLESAIGAPGRWWRARRCSSTSTGSGSPG